MHWGLARWDSDRFPVQRSWSCNHSDEVKYCPKIILLHALISLQFFWCLFTWFIGFEIPLKLWADLHILCSIFSVFLCFFFCFFVFLGKTMKTTLKLMSWTSEAELSFVCWPKLGFLFLCSWCTLTVSITSCILHSGWPFVTTKDMWYHVSRSNSVSTWKTVFTFFTVWSLHYLRSLHYIT